MQRLVVVSGSLLGGIAVATGAFGAHALRTVLDASGQAGNWETATRYALVHALAAVVAGIMASQRTASATARPALAAGACFLFGSMIFSGCLMALALSGVRILGAIVPIGGVLLIVGWSLLAVAAWRLAPTHPD
jgi:uncharacterized membrane protein YgdD (TMEM256/DUF423 family)